VGESIAALIAELAEHGSIRYHEELSAELPPTLLALRAIPGVGPRTIGEVWRQLGIATLPELEAAAREGRLRQVRGLSARAEERILAGIGAPGRAPHRRMPMGEAYYTRRLVAPPRAALGVILPAAGSGPPPQRDRGRPRRIMSGDRRSRPPRPLPGQSVRGHGHGRDDRVTWQ
jgi:DNA polymerase (family 10)